MNGRDRVLVGMRLGVLDIGSNSAQLQVVDVYPGAPPLPTHAIKEPTPEAASIRFWTGEQSVDRSSVCYRDAWVVIHPDEPGYTFMPRRNPLVNGLWRLDRDRRIDYVFVRCDTSGPSLAIIDCQRIFNEPVGGVWASDHFGVLADLTAPG